MFEGEVALDSESFSEATDESVEEMLLLDELTELLSESSLLDDSLDALDSLEELLDVFFLLSFGMMLPYNFGRSLLLC